jgi:ATP-dependent Clp protease ATP-binding subunit ClpC
VFERFTERARQAVVLAQEEARRLAHPCIGTEHLLLGLLREDEGLAARVLERAGVTLELVRPRLVAIVGAGEQRTEGQIPFTPRSKKVMELALAESLSFGHDHVGPEHLLLGLLREAEGGAGRILAELGADGERLRADVLRMLGGQLHAWQPGADWDQARIATTPAGPQLQVPLRLEDRASAVLDGSQVWQHAPLAGLHHQLERGFLLISGPGLLETVDPGELRRAIDQAVTAAHDDAMTAGHAQAQAAEAFLGRLRDPPPPHQ